MLTASTPVNAVQPEANARSTSPTSSSPPTPCSAWIPIDADSATGARPVAAWKNPSASIAKTHATKPYVGIANTLPDSLMPRRFISASTATRPSDRLTAYGARDGTAETMLATPAATDTATVRT